MVVWLFVELLAFPFVLAHISTAPLGFLGEGETLLAQTSKRGVFPRDYIALTGDSYAAGWGDCAAGAADRARDCPTPAERVHRSTGRDVVTFARPGAGILRAIIDEPLSQLAYARGLSWWAFADPDILLVFFYEGNDVDDNAWDLRVRYFQGGYGEYGRLTPGDFEGFVDAEVLGADPLFGASQQLGLSDRLLFSRSLFAAVFSVMGDSAAPPEATEGCPGRPLGSGQPGDQDPIRVHVAGRSQEIPSGLQGPAMGATERQRRQGMETLELALGALQRRLPDTRLGLVYVPSVLSAYTLESSVVHVEDYYCGQRPTGYAPELVLQRSDELVLEVEGVCSRQEVEFVDARPAVRSAAVDGLVHGPEDWRHFNDKGYRALSQAVLALCDRMGVPNNH